MIDLGDLTIVIPFYCDAIERRENLSAIISWFRANTTGLDILVIEQAATHQTIPLAGVRQVFTNNQNVFHRTHLLNWGMCELSTRPFVSSWDADALAHPQALASALETLRSGASFVFPYDGRFLDVRGSRRDVIITQGEAHSAFEAARIGDRDIVLLNANGVGGAPMFDRKRFMECGGYNERFVSWGYEDAELVDRFARLGTPYTRVDTYPLLHLSHPRGQTSSTKNPYFRDNAREWARMKRLDTAQLKAEIASGALRVSSLPKPSIAARLESRIRSFFP